MLSSASGVPTKISYTGPSLASTFSMQPSSPPGSSATEQKWAGTAFAEP